MNVRLISFFAFFFLFLQAGWCNLDDPDLNALVSDSKRLLSNAVEGSENGLFQSGSKTAFKQTIDWAVSYGATCTTVLQLDSVTDVLHDAYVSFLKKRYGIQRPLISDNYWEISAVTSRWGSHNLHDPSAIKTKGYFYVYGTDAAWARSVKGIPYRRSRDLVNWEYLGTAFNNSYPVENNVWMDSLSGDPGHTQTGIWAPYILRVGEEYRLYYCSIHNPNGAVIGLAVSSHPRGPWSQRGSVVYYESGMGMDCNGIDPTVTTGQDGRMWMAWGSWTKGLYMTELDTLTGLRKVGASQALIARNRPQWNGTLSSMEGPEIIYNPTFKKYYLFVAEGSLGTIYHTRVARSNNPNGPYVDYNNNSAINYTLNKDLFPLISYPYQFRNHPGWQGVAHSSVINVNGTFYMLNQGRPTSIPSMMDMHVKKIYWTENGWPVISPERYANPGIMPEITTNLIAGTWEEILLYEMKIGNIAEDLPGDDTDPNLFLCKPSTLVFSAAGTISPSGTWSYDGNYMTIIKGGYTYNVAVDWEWDWENGCETLIYTGLRSDGRSCWGKKSMYLNREAISMVANATFDKGMQGYIKTANNGNVTTSITDASSGALKYILGNTFSAVVNAQATNYYDQSLSWRFPAQKGARYKVNFKYRVDATTQLHIELQETAKDFTALYREYQTLSSGGTMEFITNDVSITDPYYTLNLQYGTSTQGVRLLLDNINIYDVTGQWNGNYVVNGDFECGLDSWFSTFMMSSYITATLADTTVIQGERSYKFTNSYAGEVNRSLNRLYWRAYLPGGWKYRVEFDVRGSGAVDANFRLASVASSVADLAGLYNSVVTDDVQTVGYDIPAFTSNGEYMVAFTPQGVSNFMIDNVRLYIPADTTVDIKPAIVSESVNAGIYPNPSNGIINLPSIFTGGIVKIMDLQGRTRFTAPIVTTQLNVSSLGKGLYMVRIYVNEQIYSDKLLVY